jgi:hypothetical protein
MHLLTDDEIFDLLDGTTTDTIRQRHEQLMVLDENYRLYFQQLRKLHEDIASLSLESPSLAFENKVISQWENLQPSYQVVMPRKWIPLMVAGFIISLVIIGTMILWQSQPLNDTAPQNGLERWLNSIDLTLVQDLLLLSNSLLLLLVLERILKKWWLRRLGNI